IRRLKPSSEPKRENPKSKINCLWCNPKKSCSLLVRNRKSKTQNSFDHLIGSVQHRLRDGYADLLRSLEVDHQIQFCRRFHRKVGGLGAFQNFIDVHGCAAKIFKIVGRIGHEATGFHKVTSLVHGRQSVLCGKVRNLLRVICKYGIPNRDERTRTRLGRRLKCALQVRAGTSYSQRLKLYLQSARRSLVLFKTNRSPYTVRIPEDSNTRHPWNHLLKQFQPFSAQLSGESGEPCDISSRARETIDYPSRDWILCCGYNNGDRLGRLLGCDDSFLKRGDKDIDLELHEFGYQGRDPVQLPISKAVLNQNIFPLNVAQISQALPECLGSVDVTRSRSTKKQSYPWDFLRLLRLDWKAKSQDNSDWCKAEDSSTHRVSHRVFSLAAASP